MRKTLPAWALLGFLLAACGTPAASATLRVGSRIGWHGRAYELMTRLPSADLGPGIGVVAATGQAEARIGVYLLKAGQAPSELAFVGQGNHVYEGHELLAATGTHRPPTALSDRNDFAVSQDGALWLRKGGKGWSALPTPVYSDVALMPRLALIATWDPVTHEVVLTRFAASGGLEFVPIRLPTWLVSPNYSVVPSLSARGDGWRLSITVYFAGMEQSVPPKATFLFASTDGRKWTAQHDK